MLMWRPWRTVHRIVRACVLLSFVMVAETAYVMAQEAAGFAAMAPSNQAAPAPPITSQSGTSSGTQPIDSLDEGQPISPSVRRFHYTLNLDVRGVYDDNVTLSNSAPISDYYLSIDPSLVIGFGDITGSSENFLRVSYYPQFLIFLENDHFNTVQHGGEIDGQYRLNRLSLNLGSNIHLLESGDFNSAILFGTIVGPVNLDVSGRSRTHIFDTRLDASYELTGKTSLTSSVNHTLTTVENGFDSNRVSGNLGTRWSYSPKIALGANALAGLASVDGPGGDQSFQQLNATLSYDATGKITFDGSAGVEVREFDSNKGESITPVFQLGFNYTPFDGTKIDGSATRRILTSATLAGENFESNQVLLAVQQRLLQRFSLGLSTGYQNQTYYRTIAGPGSDREDNYYFLSPAIDVRITNFWSAGLYYLHRKNSSSLDIFGFTDDQVGIRSGLTF